jgi:hypothetical protein
MFAQDLIFNELNFLLTFSNSSAAWKATDESGD